MINKPLQLAINISLWTVILGLSAYFFLDNVVAYFFGYRSPIFGDTFFHNQFWVVMHMAGGTLTLFFGPVQFWSFIRRRWVNVHRTLGKLYVGGVALAGVSALRLSVISPCVPCRISLLILSILAILSTALAWVAIKRGRIEDHRKFMIRSYICVLAFVAVRLDDIVSLDFLFGAIEDGTFRRVVNEYFFSFVPLIAGEVIMTWIPTLKRQPPFPIRKKTNVDETIDNLV
jgi:uncharacterized membrane protein